ncbi:hypothetical protein D3C72_1490050 [compost metagenome]
MYHIDEQGMLVALRIPRVLRLQRCREEFINRIQRKQGGIVPGDIQILEVLLFILFIRNFIIRIFKIHVKRQLIRVPTVRCSPSNRAKQHARIRIFLDQKRELRVGGSNLDYRHLNLLLDYKLETSGEVTLGNPGRLLHVM